MKRTLCAALAVLAVSGCAAQPERLVETSSGKPEGVFRSKSADEVSNLLAGRCAGAPGMRLSMATRHMVECRGQMEGAEAVLVQFAIGNSYSTTPEGIMSFTIVEQGPDVRVYGEASVETIMAFGQPRRYPLTHNNFNNLIQEGLWKIGAERPSGA